MISIYEGISFAVAIPEQNVNEIIKAVIAKISDMLVCKVNVQLRKSYEEQDCIGIKKNDFYLDFSTELCDYNENWTENQAKSVALCVKEIVKRPVNYRIHRGFITPCPEGVV